MRRVTIPAMLPVSVPPPSAIADKIAVTIPRLRYVSPRVDIVVSGAATVLLAGGDAGVEVGLPYWGRLGGSSSRLIQPQAAALIAESE